MFMPCTQGIKFSRDFSSRDPACSETQPHNPGYYSRSRDCNWLGLRWDPSTTTSKHQHSRALTEFPSLNYEIHATAYQQLTWYSTALGKSFVGGNGACTTYRITNPSELRGAIFSSSRGASELLKGCAHPSNPPRAVRASHITQVATR